MFLILRRLLSASEQFLDGKPNVISNLAQKAVVQFRSLCARFSCASSLGMTIRYVRSALSYGYDPNVSSKRQTSLGLSKDEPHPPCFSYGVRLAIL